MKPITTNLMLNIKNILEIYKKTDIVIPIKLMSMRLWNLKNFVTVVNLLIYG